MKNWPTDLNFGLPMKNWNTELNLGLAMKNGPTELNFRFVMFNDGKVWFNYEKLASWAQFRFSNWPTKLSFG